MLRALLESGELISIKDSIVIPGQSRRDAIADWEPLAEAMGRLGHNVEWLANRHDLSLGEVAMLAGLSERALRDILAATKAPSLWTIALIAAVFDLDPATLLLPLEQVVERLQQQEAKLKAELRRREESFTPEELARIFGDEEPGSLAVQARALKRSGSGAR